MYIPPFYPTSCANSAKHRDFVYMLSYHGNTYNYKIIDFLFVQELESSLQALTYLR